jgi:hypothetical protein
MIWMLRWGLLSDLRQSVILTLRVWALWGRGRNIGIFLGAVSIINCTIGILGYITFGPTYYCVSKTLFQPCLTANLRHPCTPDIPMDSFSPTLPGCFFNLGYHSLFWISFAALTTHLTCKSISYLEAKEYSKAMNLVIFIMTMLKAFQYCASKYNRLKELW